MNHTSIAEGAAVAVSPAGAAASIRQRADPRAVLADRVSQLYGQMWLSILATFAIGAIATFEFWEVRLRELVLFWWGLVLLVTAASGGLLYAYRRSADKALDPQQWLRWLGIAALANGANWGFAAAVFFPSHTDEQQVFLAFLLAGMMSGGIPVYAASWPIFALYAAGIVAPFTYVLATFGNRLFAEIALLVPMFYAINVAIAYRLTQVFHSGYRLRHAYGRLTEDYSVLNQRLERQLVELEEARRQVEASGRKLELFAQRAPIAVLEMTAKGAITEVNSAAELLFGYTAAELTGRDIRFLVRPQFHDEFDLRWNRLISTHSPEAGLIRNPRRDGIDVICDWTFTPLVNPEGTVIAVLAQGRDVTAQREAERGVHLDAEPRAAYPPHFDHRLAATHQHRRGRRARQGHRRDDPGGRAQRPAPARPDQRSAGRGEDRIGQAHALAGSARDRRAGARGDAAEQGLWRSLSSALRARLLAAGPQGSRGPQAPAAGDDQPAFERRQVLARRRRGGNPDGRVRA
jgi:PAS domain S-box-containing protein